MYRKQIEEYIDNHKEEMLQDLSELVRIESTKGEALPGKPFGEGPARALAAAEEMMKKYGMLTKNYDNYVVAGDLSQQEKGLDILAHLDIVPVTPDWTATKPFDPIVKDGKIYGRGTADDKGPAIAALYAMRAIKELGIPLQKNVRLILGADEECGSSDLKHYYSIENEAPMSFTPDADFPVINLEKGRLEAEYECTFEEEILPAVSEMEGGDKVNVVPAKAYAAVKGISEEIIREAIGKDKSGVKFETEAKEDQIVIHAKGLAAHASTPEMGQNALTALVGLLAGLPLADSKKTAAVKALANMFPHGDVTGKALGISMEDEISGNLTMNLGVLKMKDNHLEISLDSRVPVCGNDENVTKVVDACMSKHEFTMKKGQLIKPHYVPADTPFVQTLLKSYERYTGQKGEARAIGGGTYVHELERGVAFGCMMDDVDNHMHGDDEFMVVDVLLMSAKIFADVICELCK